VLIVIYTLTQKTPRPYMWGWGSTKSRDQKMARDPIETQSMTLNMSYLICILIVINVYFMFMN